jgi:hypothetical protein
MINLDELLYSAYTLGVETEKDSPVLNQAQLRSILLRNVPMLGKIDVAEAKSEKAAAPVAEKKTRKQSSAAGKPRAVPEDDTRCHARSFYEKDHIENGTLKVVRDDEKNQFGDRCKFKKTDGNDFCKHHAEKQPHGVWDGEYDGKFKTYLNKPAAAASSETSSVAPKAAPAKKSAPVAEKKKVAPKEEEDDDQEDQSDDEFMEGDILEKSGVQYDWVEIEDESFMIDSDGNVYDPETEKKIGKYDTKTKKWLSGGIPSADNEDEE